MNFHPTKALKIEKTTEYKYTLKIFRKEINVENNYVLHDNKNKHIFHPLVLASSPSKRGASCNLQGSLGTVASIRT